ncbi:hypothetical protein EPO15_09585 [bacterium]|nr:MAG: hypothetical protein EPO15_09585 [bacterium]
MNRPFAAAFLPLALLAALAGAAAAEDPKPEEKPADPAPAASAPADTSGSPKYGTFALDAAGNKVSGDALSKLPPEAQWAMKEKGYSPVLGPNGEVLGYDNGMMCILPDAVGKDYAAAAEQAKLGPGVQGPCPASFPDCHSKEPAQPPPPTETAGDVAGMIPAEPGGKNHCDQPGPPPPCAPKPEDPKEVAKQEAEKSSENAFNAASAGDVAGTREAIEKRNAAEDKGRAGSGNPGFGSDDGDTRTASNDPVTPMSTSGGGQGIGAQGQVGGGNGGGIAGKQVRAGVDQEADALIAFQQGMKNGPMDGPSDPNVQSVAQRANQGLGGRAMDAARSLFSTLSESLGVAADAPDTDLSDQLATSPIDGATANRAAIKVVECNNDTLNGTAGGRKARRVNGC